MRSLGTGFIGLFLVAATAAWVAWSWGPAGRATSDSASYLDGARHLAQGQGFRSSFVRIGSNRLTPIVDQAPGFSVLMACGIRVGLDARESAAVVLATSYVLYGAALYVLLLEVAGGAWWPLSCLLAVVVLLHPGVLLLLDSVGSDLPAAALWISGVWLAVRLLRANDPGRLPFVVAAICMSAALLTRWAMFYALLALCPGLLIALPRPWQRDRLRWVIGFLLLPLCALAANVLRNFVTTRTLFGYRRVALDDPLRVGAEAISGFSSGFWVGDLGGGLDLARRALTLVLPALLLVTFTTPQGRRSPAVRLLLACVGGYALLLIASASVSPIDSLRSQRFWAPAWPLLAAAAIGALASIRGGVGTATVIVFTALLLLTGAGFARDFLDKLPEARSGSGFFKDSIARSVPMRFLFERGVPDCTLFSNDPRVVLMYWKVDRIHSLPESAADLDAVLRSGGVCILLFTEAMTARIEERLPAARRLVETLYERRLVERVAADGAGEVWLSTKAP